MVDFYFLCRNPIFDKTVNYSLGVFSKNDIFALKKIKIADTLPVSTSICQLHSKNELHTCTSLSLPAKYGFVQATPTQIFTPNHAYKKA